MGSRKRRVIKIIKKTIPKVFNCPQCGMNSIKVYINDENNEKFTKIICGNCNLSYKYKIKEKKQNIDIYNDFIDKFLSGSLLTNDRSS